MKCRQTDFSVYTNIAFLGNMGFLFFFKIFICIKDFCVAKEYLSGVSLMFLSGFDIGNARLLK